MRDRLRRRATHPPDETDADRVVLPGLYVNGHFPSSELRLTGRTKGTSKKKGTFLKIEHSKRSYFRRDGQWHRIFRAFLRPDRLGLTNEPWYAETIVDEETGEVVHSDSEPLSEHTGHGSAKQRPTDGAPSEVE